MHEIIYFNGKGRAECIRIMLSAAEGIEFKDTRLTFPEWGEMKPNTPLGFLPLLKLDDSKDDEVFCQSNAMLRYAGRKAGFYPNDDREALIVDMAIDTINELAGKMPKADKTLREEYQEKVLIPCAKFLESWIQKNGGVGFVPSPSIADLMLWNAVLTIRRGIWDHVDPKSFDSFPGICATTDAMAKNEKVVAYYDSLESK